jgi:hypothetical protein
LLVLRKPPESKDLVKGLAPALRVSTRGVTSSLISLRSGRLKKIASLGMTEAKASAKKTTNSERRAADAREVN